MTAEERMRERAAQVCDEAHAFDANERGGKHGVAHGLASEIRALPLEGEQGEPVAGLWSVEPHGDGWALYIGRDKEHHGGRVCNLSDGMPTDYERIAYALNFAAQGEPAKDQRGAAVDAAAESATRHASGTPPTGICNERDAAGNAVQSAPHHHSRPEQFEWVEIGFNARLDAEPAPAREPVHNDWSKAKAKVLAKYPAAQYEAMQGYLPPYGHIVWINHKRDAPSDRGYGLSNATSEQEAWLEAARNLPAPAREPAVEEVRHRLEIIADLVAERKRTYNLEAELDRLRAENAEWRTWGVIEVAVRNPSVAEYMRHWEGRATKAEAENAALREQLQGGVAVPREPTEEMIDAPRQIILYSETPGRTLEGLRAHLERSGVNYLAWFPVWATRDCGHLTKAAIAILIYRAMLAAAKEPKHG